MKSTSSSPGIGSASAPTARGTVYSAVWRWHIYTGLFVAFFAIFLAVTGAIYLWKPQFEEWRYKDYFNVPAEQTIVSPDVQLASARSAYPGWVAKQITPSLKAGRTAEIVMIDSTGGKHSVFVNPHNGATVGQIAEKDRFMVTLHDLHDSFLLGKGTIGEMVVELASSWAFVMLITGFYLWWPRPFNVRGFLLLRVNQGKRTFLRDLHSVPAVWLSALTLILLISGLPWASVTGGWFSTLAKGIGEWAPSETKASAHRSELLGGWSPFLSDKVLADKVSKVASAPPAEDEHAMHRGMQMPPATTSAGSQASSAKVPPGSPGEADEHAMHRGMKMAPPAYVIDPAHPPISLARVMEIAGERQVHYAYYIVLPQVASGVYSILTTSDSPFTVTYIHLDQYSGKVLADVRYKDLGALAKFFALGKSAHMGTLFGLPNQIIGLIAALGVVLLASTGVLMWWSRRPVGRVAALAKPPSFFGMPTGMLVIVVVVAALLPFLAASGAFLFVLDTTLVYSGIGSYLRRKSVKPADSEALALRVNKIRQEAAEIKSFELVSAAGSPLPVFTAGAHINVKLEEGLVRQYSLCNDPSETDRYVIAVKRVPDSRGGSIAMYELVDEGDTLSISPPRNHFPIDHSARHHLLMAGGIGVTPLLSMARHLQNTGASYELHYFTRSIEHTAFHDVLSQPEFHGKVTFHYSIEPDRLHEYLHKVLWHRPDGAHLYLCGPGPFMDLVEATAASTWPPETVHLEYFGADPMASAGPCEAFEITLARTGTTYTIPADKNIVQLLAEKGVVVPTSCEQGVCGTCLTGVLEGTPDHRDAFLTEAERKAGGKMMVCVSRAKTKRLVLDL